MKLGLKPKLLCSFLLVILVVLAGVSIGGSLLIKNYFLNNKQRELSSKAHEMTRIVADYYDGKLSLEQLNMIANRVDSFLNARIWVVDEALSIVTVSEQQIVASSASEKSLRTMKQSPSKLVKPEAEDQIPKQQEAVKGKASSNHLSEPGAGMQKTMIAGQSQMNHGDQSMMGKGMGRRMAVNSLGPQAEQEQQRQSDNQLQFTEMKEDQSEGVVELTPPSEETSFEYQTRSMVLEFGQLNPKLETTSQPINLVDITGMENIVQAVKKNYGANWVQSYYHPYYEENMLIVAVPLQQVDGSIRGTVMIHAPIEEIDGFLQQIYYYIGFAGIIAIILAMVSALYLSRGITQPLYEMRQVAAAMASGDYSRRIQTGIGDEIGELGKSLNLLANDLGNHVNYLEKIDATRRDFVANVSHELRTPLTIMKGYNQALRDGMIADPTVVNKYHNVIGDEIGRLENLISELLDLSQLQSGDLLVDKEPVSLREVIENVMTLVSHKSKEKGVTLISDLPASAPMIIGDGDRLTQLVLIFMDNALKFTPPGGQIICRLVITENKQQLSIIDSGRGISNEDLPFIWDRFYKGDKSRASEGTGLGLAIAKQIIEIHDGTVSVTSGSNEGTSFAITFGS